MSSAANIDALALLTPTEMAQADHATIDSGVRGIELMAAAGTAVANAVQQRWSRQPVLVLCGPGNNGGDGFVAARQLQQLGWPVRLALLGTLSQLQGDAAHHALNWSGTIEPFSLALLDGVGVVIDAIFGAGLARPVAGLARELIEALSATKIPICAVDVPSGLDGATGLVAGAVAAASITVTFFRKKPGHLLFPGRQLCGEVIVADIGIAAKVLAQIAPQAHENGPLLWQQHYPWPRIDGHKYQRGHVLVLGGEQLTGASRLTAVAAARVGAGLVTLAAPQAAWSVYAAALTSVMVQAIDSASDFEALLSDPRRNAIAIGPGAGTADLTRYAVVAALASQRAVVLDADALTAFADDPQTLFQAIGQPCVLTPHEGEFARLFEASGDKLTRARRAAKVSGAVVLLKGADTVIAAPSGRAIINSNGPADLATGGSGDVLTGFIAGLLAQGLDPFHAAAAAAWLHGEIATAFGPGLIAEDLLAGLPAVLKQLKAR